MNSTSPYSAPSAPRAHVLIPQIAPWIRRRPLALVAFMVLLLAIAVGAFIETRSASAVRYVTAPVVRTDLTQTVTASGTVNPQNTILVGTQVSGTISEIYVDYNSKVHTGEVLARIDPSTFEATLAQAQGNLAQLQAQAQAASQSITGTNFSASAASAAAASARANLAKSQAVLSLAQITLDRDRALLAQGFLAKSQFDTDSEAVTAAAQAVRGAQSDYAQSVALSGQQSSNAVGSTSTAAAAQAAVQAAQATVTEDRLNLERTVITSPVTGTVVARNVSVGQTVAASFQTPTLFTIAQDLKKMEVDIAVGEPDIGNMRSGNAVDFSVLAYPNNTFHGIVSQVRVNPTTISNVVTYTVVVLVNNEKNLLLPGMTANANIHVAHVGNALVVPVGALTYRPARASGPRQPRPTNSGTTTTASSNTAAVSPWGATAGGSAGAIVGGTRGVLFVLRGGKPHAVPVRVDLVNGMLAAVTPMRGTLDTNDLVVTADSAPHPQRSAGASPPPGLGRMIR